MTGESYPATVERLVLQPLALSASNYQALTEPSGIALLAFGHGPDGVVDTHGFRLHPELAAAGLWTTPSDLVQMVIAIIRSYNGAPNVLLPPDLARAMLTPVAENSGLGAFIDAKGRFSHEVRILAIARFMQDGPWHGGDDGWRQRRTILQRHAAACAAGLWLGVSFRLYLFLVAITDHMQWPRAQLPHSAPVDKRFFRAMRDPHFARTGRGNRRR